MLDALSDPEIRELSAAFHAPEAARQLLEAAGLPRGRQPGWQERSAEEFWREVDTLLRSGVLASGRDRVLDAARHRFPANPVFAAEPPENAAGTATPPRERAGAGPTVTMTATAHGGGRVYQAGRDLYITDE